MDIAAWLRGLGLDRHVELFRAHDIGLDIAADLTDGDLAALGLSLGDRKRLLRAAASLRAPGTAGGGRQTPRSQPQRRHLTVMFVDLVGSTALSARVDPEEMREVISAYQAAVATEIGRFEGYVAKYMGDGVLAYFGWPNAHEDEVERAVRAGLATTAAVARLFAPGGGSLTARVGIATGLVVVGDLIGEGATQEEAVVGETPNLASRLQALAEPGTVVISAATRRLLGDLFDLKDIGARQLPGFEQPIPAFHVIARRPSAGRFEAMRGVRLTPLVERESEIERLLELWRLATSGAGQVVLIGGEAGIGKSRLLQALSARLDAAPCTRLSYFCSPFHRGTAFHPILDHIGRMAGLDSDDLSGVRLHKLAALFAPVGDAAAEAARLTAALLSPTAGSPDDLSAQNPQGRKSRLQRLWLDQLDCLARRRPILLVIEDAHWIDPTSLELLDLVVERIKRLPVLLVVTHRPEFQLSERRHAHVATLTLDRLDPCQSAALIVQAAAGKGLPKPLLDLLVAKADGVPLFLEELLKTVLESGQLEDMGDRWRLAGALPTLTIPATLQDSLLARIERMAPAREVAQVAAAIGRQFSRELVSRATQLDDLTLDLALAQLTAGELIHPLGAPSGDSYSFKHALVRDAAYGTLLRGRRALIHGRIASELLMRDGEYPPEIVAHHLTEAGEAERSVAFWERAGQLAVSRAASREAVAHYQHAISQLLSLPETIERKRREAGLQDALGGALAHIAGVESDALAQVHQRVRELSRQTGDVKRQFVAEWNLWHVHVARWEHRRAEAVGSSLMAMAESVGDPELLLQALHVEWSTLGPSGQPMATRSSCDRGWALYDPERHGRHHLIFGAHDPGVCSRVICAFETWCLGRPDEALACYEAGL